MTIEADFRAVLAPFVGGRAFPDVGPAGVAKPYATFQQVGGESLGFLERGKASKKNARMQVNVWALTRLEANTIARAIEDAIVSAPTLQSDAIGAFTAVHEADTGLYGTQQDFYLWFDD